jgi:putative transposase
MDKYSRLSVAIRVGRRCKAKDLVAVLNELTSLDPAPAFFRSDNGPEFIAHVHRRRAESSATTTAYSERGAAWQNGFAKSFNRRLRDEFLNTELVTTVAEAQALADRWRCEYYTPSRRIRPSRGLRPWRQLKQLLHNHPLSKALDR